jgi:AcrR family transcriptional regulator
MSDKSKTTRQGILDSACRIFSEKGYHRATIDDICRSAGANIALVNYYFGDKASLYDAVWKQSFECAVGTYPLDESVGDEAEPREHLYAAVHAILRRMFDEGDAGIFSRLMVQEMACPTLKLSDIADKAIRPQFEHICGILRAFLGEDADEGVVTRCAIGIMGQCIIFATNRPLRSRILGDDDFDSDDVDRLADHIALFSTAGLKAVNAAGKADGEQ